MPEDVPDQQAEDTQDAADSQEASSDVPKSLVFVVMPFSDEYQAVYDKVIKPTISELGFECLRGDEIHVAGGNIDQDTVRHIARAAFCIADLSGANANVFYELGLCHALGRATILVCQDETVPFDLNNYRHIPYSNTEDGFAALRQKLRDFVENIDEARRELSNPVADFLGSTYRGHQAEELTDPVACFTALCQSLEAFIKTRKDGEAISLLRALPTEMSQHSFHDQMGAASILLARYEDLIKEYVEKPVLDDVTVFGCPVDLSCLRDTLECIKKSYFAYPKDGKAPNVMEVSAVGFHPYLRRYSLFLLGRRKIHEDDVDRYDTGFIFFLNKRGVPIKGIRSSDVTTVEILQHMWGIILDEIEHDSRGVPPTTQQQYAISTENHEKLFRDGIANDMISHFNAEHGTSYEIVVEPEGDEVDVKRK